MSYQNYGYSIGKQPLPDGWWSWTAWQRGYQVSGYSATLNKARREVDGVIEVRGVREFWAGVTIERARNERSYLAYLFAEYTLGATARWAPGVWSQAESDFWFAVSKCNALLNAYFALVNP